MTQQLLDNNEIVTELDISHLVIEDDTPVDNFQSAQQQRLLVEPLYSSQALPMPFIAEANVGCFTSCRGLHCPGCVVESRVQRAEDYSERRNRSYFVWEFGKVPEVCIELVSNKEGNELVLSRKAQQEGKTESKKAIYAQMGVPYYVVLIRCGRFQELPRCGTPCCVWTLVSGRYVELTPEEGIVTTGQPILLETVELGLTLWEGQFEEDVTRLWLRWCNREGQVILTGAEGREIEQQRAERAEAKTQRLAERLRDLGINPDEV